MFGSNRTKRVIKSSTLVETKWAATAGRQISTTDLRCYLIPSLVLPLVEMRVLLMCSKSFYLFIRVLVLLQRWLRNGSLMMKRQPYEIVLRLSATFQHPKLSIVIKIFISPSAYTENFFLGILFFTIHRKWKPTLTQYIK